MTELDRSRRSGSKVSIKTDALDALLGGSNPVEASLGVRPATPPATEAVAAPSSPSPAIVSPAKAPQPEPSVRLRPYVADTERLPDVEVVRSAPTSSFSVTIRTEVKDLAFSVYDALYGPPHHYSMGQFIEEAIMAHAKVLSERYNDGRPFPPPANPRRAGRRRGKMTRR